MSAQSAVVASTPFLTVDQVASELNIPRSAVRRLIALRALGAFRTPVADGEWKIMPEALAQYVAAGSPRAVIPLGNKECNEYLDGDLARFAEHFESEVREQLSTLFTETCPVKGVVDGQSFTLPATPAVSTVIKEMGKKPARWWSQMPKAEPSNCPDRASQFLASRLLRQTMVAAQPTMTEMVNGQLSNWDKLFDSPESFRGFVDSAWQKLSEFRIVVSHLYAVDDARGGWCRVYFQIPYSTFGASLPNLEQLVF